MSSETDPPAAEEPSSADDGQSGQSTDPNRDGVIGDEEPVAREPAAAPLFGPPGSVTPRQLLEKYRSSWRTYPKLWIAGVVVAVAIAGVLVWPWFDTGDDEAELRVRAYLEAVRDKDLLKADDIAHISGSGSRQLLRDDVLDTNWTIHTLRSKDFDEEGLTAEVMAVLKGANEEYARYDFKLSRAGNQLDANYLIDNGYINAYVMGVNKSNMQVNGVPVERAENDGDYLDAKELLLYPGVYRFGHAFEDFVDVDWRQRLWTGGSYQVDVTGADVDTMQLDPSETWNFNAAGEAEAQQLMESHIDECATEEAVLLKECPFGAEEVEVPGDEDYIFDTDELDDISWEIAEYPEVTVAQQDNTFRFADRTRGVANLTATAERGDGTVVDIDMECEIRTSSLTLTTDAGGEFDVEQYQEFPELRMWSTC